MAVYNLHEITDSKLMYDRKPPKFMMYIIIIVTALIGAFLVWASKSVKTYVVKGQGIITTDSKAQVMSAVSGQIKEVHVQEGSKVKEGDVLFVLNAVEANIQAMQLEEQLRIYDMRIKLLERAEQDAAKGKNSFDKDKVEEKEFYNKLEASYASRKQYNVDEKSLKSQGYTDEQVKQYNDQIQLKIQQEYYETILGFTSEKVQLQLERSQLETEKSAIQNSSKEFRIIAPRSGKVHLTTAYTRGMVVQGGNLIGSIAGEEGLIIETFVPSVERPRVSEEDEVAIAVEGLSQIEYGTIKGKVLSIDEDATIDNQNGNAFFKIRIRPEKTYLQDKTGEKVNLTLGMVTETRIKYEKITYMKYILEQIGIK
ncbi:MAG: HlyD family efflux transporter periplasmic adaptor subunit [Clostridiales bacterium]|nr:HlyD family efflux transporter periplasmic adaptor subunit [Clostridiales bacterium]